MYTFLKTHSKVHIQAPGCVKELDEMAHSFVENSNNREQILSEAETFIEYIECEEVKKLYDLSISECSLTRIFSEKKAGKDLQRVDERSS